MACSPFLTRTELVIPEPMSLDVIFGGASVGMLVWLLALPLDLAGLVQASSSSARHHD